MGTGLIMRLTVSRREHPFPKRRGLNGRFVIPISRRRDLARALQYFPSYYSSKVPKQVSTSKGVDISAIAAKMFGLPCDRAAEARAINESLIREFSDACLTEDACASGRYFRLKCRS